MSSHLYLLSRKGAGPPEPHSPILDIQSSSELLDIGAVINASDL